MKCSHCMVEFHDKIYKTHIAWCESYTGWYVLACRCPSCQKFIIHLQEDEKRPFMVFPSGHSRPPVQSEVPPGLAQDYTEACQVLPISPKASAALARRALQYVLRHKGYKGRDLNAEIDLLLNNEATPSAIRTSVDAIRNFGNFSAHPVTDQTTLQVIDVEDHEAEWCLDILYDLFDHFYVKPAAAAQRKAVLDLKLKAAGKLPSK